MGDLWRVEAIVSNEKGFRANQAGGDPQGTAAARLERGTIQLLPLMRAESPPKHLMGLLRAPRSIGLIWNTMIKQASNHETLLFGHCWLDPA
jgi:hypothetical protein